MDVFALRDRLIRDYADYASSFVHVADERIHARVDEDLSNGLLWPEPLVQLNPTFEPGGLVDELVDDGVLHEECRHIFRLDKDRDLLGRDLRLHRHQVEAIRAAKTGASYVLTTGTGSGKSLAYIVPIVDWVLRNGSGGGVKAIVVYPMNALANSQLGELEKFLGEDTPAARRPVTFARYTGQESDERKNEIVEDPPDILLTNYVMLELILTRPREQKLVRTAKGLHFLVLDELHTYRGRQGADVAMLVRRAREAFEAPGLQCVGTSATLAGRGTYEDQRREVARVATRLFGTEVRPEQVIGETLQRATEEHDLTSPAFAQALRARMGEGIDPSTMAYEEFVGDPLSVWIESTLGVERDAASGRLVRRTPRALTGPEGAARELAELAGVPEAEALARIQSQLMAGQQIRSEATGVPVFAFRLHQFISRGETAYASVEPENERFITTAGQTYVPGDREKVLFPLAFCRECGQDYYVVTLHHGRGERIVTPRAFGESSEDGDSEDGYLYLNTRDPWPVDAEGIIDRIPDDWTEESGGARRVKSSFQKLLPRPIRVSPLGAPAAEGVEVHFAPTPFRFCLACGVAYGGQTRSDYGKLGTLGAGGRSTATTILSLALIRGLRGDEDLPAKAKKLLSFTDNRQDASLQAGHFNDFVEITLLRSALYRAMSRAGADGIAYDVLAQRVFDALALPLALYAADPDVKFRALEETHRALKNVIGHRVYRDLERGWRVTSPNLEQCGLLRVAYESLEELCAAEGEWASRHPALATATPVVRHRVATALLDFMRRELCIKVDYLDATYQEQLKQQSSVRLRAPWSIDEHERLETARWLLPRSSRRGDYGGYLYLSTRGGFGQLVRRRSTFPDYEGKLAGEGVQRVLLDLVSALKVAGLVEVVAEPKSDEDVPAYQIPASAFRWVAGDGSVGYHDQVRLPRAPEGGLRANAFFVSLYKTVSEDTKGLEAREHTAQVPSDLREQREEAFRSASLPILYCSPTMELGVDIAELNAVNMRNVPPTPANYAQRSGRAGRSGQPALVFTYCATGSPHDQYFFRRPEMMVSGQVAPPRIDLANEDLVRAHVHAIWLAETTASLGASLKDVLDLSGEQPTLAILPSVRDQLESAQALTRARARARAVLASIEEDLAAAQWHHEGWLDEALGQAVRSFGVACGRWRGLYRAALAQSKAQQKIVLDPSRPAKDKEQAKRLRREAESQLELLTAADAELMQSDFYSYRYFASEGFLPGYSFPRLPLSAYIPARRPTGGRDEFLSRPRFLAISEFGPRSFIYHEGSRYIINKVILPVAEEGTDEPVLTRSAKRCERCGYLHPVEDGVGPDLCERCGQALDGRHDDLFRLQNVSTRRRDRITSDEEERMRQGYELRTAVRFVGHGGQPSFRVGEIMAGERAVGRLTHGQAATIWRMNLGWRRSYRKGNVGFTLDAERGYWQKSDHAGDDLDDPMSARRSVVVPYVEDHKNCLLFEPAEELSPVQLASLQWALANAVQVVYQLEDQELAAEPLPDAGRRRLILLYEAAEGGAGVLRHLLDDPRALADVAREALRLCHFDPGTGADLGQAPGAKERCEAACYDCLLSYRNQREQELLDRHAIRDLLLELAGAKVVAGPGPKTRAEHLGSLVALCDSELERDWLRMLDERGHHLPTRAQVLVEAAGSRPDFLYDGRQAAVFIDGPHHEHPEERRADAEQTERLEDLGYVVVRFAADRDAWPDVLAKHPDLFGSPA